MIYNKGNTMVKKDIRYKSELKSYYCYPNENTLEYLPTFINRIEEPPLRMLLSLITCCGYRVCEALNSFIYKEGDRWIVQAPMEKKKRFTKHIMNERGFLGESHLNMLLKDNPKLWKNNELKFIFPNNDTSWMADKISEDPFHPRWIFGENVVWTKYKTYYAHLHEYDPFEVKYRTNRYQMFSTTKHIPSFHFFRKGFCAQACRMKTFRNIVELTQYIGWDKLDMAMYYVADYGQGDEQQAVKLFDSSKFHYED